jgi:hypothetical protein
MTMVENGRNGDIARVYLVKAADNEIATSTFACKSFPVPNRARAKIT